ncbi:replication protein A, subunit RPA32 [Auricularia subglabra TFB-10046 SS5]|nr:replication protein A, subunit RPA32 [Auricularia subglabra TFB-10046 SS5]
MSGYQNNAFYPSSGGGMSQGGGFMSPSTQTDSPGGLKKSTAPPVRPVTIRMLMGAESTHADSGFKIDGHKLESVTIVGKVLKVEKTDTNRRYSLEDSTDQIEARYWIDSQATSIPEDDEVVEDVYVRVIGTLKAFNNKRSLHAATVRRVTDHHEIYAHNMDVIATYLLNTKGAPTLGLNAPAPQGSGAGAYSASASTATQVASSQQYSNMPPTQRAICEFLRNHPGHTMGGADIKTIVHGIKHLTDATSTAISQALDELMDQGAVFQTKSDTMYDVTVM